MYYAKTRKFCVGIKHKKSGRVSISYPIAYSRSHALIEAGWQHDILWNLNHLRGTSDTDPYTSYLYEKDKTRIFAVVSYSTKRVLTALLNDKKEIERVRRERKRV